MNVLAPERPHGWLNRRLFAGTLQGPQPQRQAVRVRVFPLDRPATLAPSNSAGISLSGTLEAT